MKKKRYSRQLIAKLTAKEVRSCEFYAKTGRRINAAKVQIDFYRDNNVVAKVTFCDDGLLTSRPSSDGTPSNTLHFVMVPERRSLST